MPLKIDYQKLQRLLMLNHQAFLMIAKNEKICNMEMGVLSSCYCDFLKTDFRETLIKKGVEYPISFDITNVPEEILRDLEAKEFLNG